jgi:hypothetical protein
MTDSRTTTVRLGENGPEVGVQGQAAVHALPVVPIPGTRKPGRVGENRRT